MPLALVEVGDVGRDGERLAARVRDPATVCLERPLERCVALVQRARGADDLAAFGGEELRDLLADPAARAGDDATLPSSTSIIWEYSRRSYRVCAKAARREHDDFFPPS